MGQSSVSHTVTREHKSCVELAGSCCGLKILIDTASHQQAHVFKPSALLVLFDTFKVEYVGLFKKKKKSTKF